jgi:ABC-2 type transport system permease protein
MVLFQHLAVRHGTVYGPGQQLNSLIGFLVWYLCMKVMTAIPAMIEEEASVGTLENIWTSPVSPVKILSMRVITLCLRYGMETCLLAIMLGWLLHLSLNLTPLAILIVLLTLAGTCGVGMGLAGLSVVYKSVSSVTDVISSLALIISGALVPLNSLGQFFIVLKYLFPTTWGIDLLRQTLTGGTVTSEEVAGLLLQTVLFIILGLWIFNQQLLQAKKQGSLSAY